MPRRNAGQDSERTLLTDRWTGSGLGLDGSANRMTAEEEDTKGEGDAEEKEEEDAEEEEEAEEDEATEKDEDKGKTTPLRHRSELGGDACASLSVKAYVYQAMDPHLDFHFPRDETCGSVHVGSTPQCDHELGKHRVRVSRRGCCGGSATRSKSCLNWRGNVTGKRADTAGDGHYICQRSAFSSHDRQAFLKMGIFDR